MINRRILRLAIFCMIILGWLVGVGGMERVSAQGEVVRVYFFNSRTCPHCASEEEFLKGLVVRYEGQVEVYGYEVTESKENLELLRKVGERLEVDVRGVPFTVVGKNYLSGYLNDETSGTALEVMIKACLDQGCEDRVKDLVRGDEVVEVLGGMDMGDGEMGKNDNSGVDEQLPQVPEKMRLPILGEVSTGELSLPVLTVVIGALDGFNPCAMWVLVFLISMLLGMKDRKRMWILGGAFIFTSGFIYFLFMSAWLNLFLFLGLVIWVRVLVGLVALGAGGYSLWDWWTNKEGACKVTGGEKKKKTFDRIKGIAGEKQFLVALVGIMFLAIAVNMVELVCSAGLPAVYTQVLALNQLETWKYYAYLVLYIIVFMLDDMIVFGAAMVTLKLTGLEGKYARWSRLIGGVVMLGIGVAMLLKPEILMFGG